MKIFTLLILFISTPILADKCQEITLNETSSDYKVFASATKGLHIKFYEDVKFAVLSNDAAWKSHSNPLMKNHFWLFSKNFSEKNNLVGSTFILSSERSVNLVFQQKADASSCLLINDSENKSIVIADYTQNEPVKPKQTSPLITSSYQFDKSEVMSVSDDSRFTFVHLNGFSVGKPLYSVIALSEGKKRVISNPTFDPMTNTYTINGIHDELLFEKGNHSFSVKRL